VRVGRVKEGRKEDRRKEGMKVKTLSTMRGCVSLSPYLCLRCKKRKGGRKEGRKEGMEEGRKEGMKEGRKEGGKVIKEGRSSGILAALLLFAPGVCAGGGRSAGDVATPPIHPPRWCGRGDDDEAAEDTECRRRPDGADAGRHFLRAADAAAAAIHDDDDATTMRPPLPPQSAPAVVIAAAGLWW
jgi:hypothetical protein